ncbi:hypothetical protein [Silvimonas sp.]|uniref:hypothetical protein n=1 Tax=Silvimonas sp. TaxID=2650811 RepID=UPI00283E53C2|nr:hypothetical protein [Silvimonas sp.]MDR3429226.1 hypothetical protein [Silvimonas sp.]
MLKNNLSKRLLAISFALLALGMFDVFPGVSIISSAYAAEPAKLGDLASFRTIVVDTLNLVQKGDLAGGKTRIKDLETSWDDAEPSLKPRAATDWHAVDKAIDNALSELRSNHPDQAGCKKSLTDLLAIMDKVGGKH